MKNTKVNAIEEFKKALVALATAYWEEYVSESRDILLSKDPRDIAREKVVALFPKGKNAITEYRLALYTTLASDGKTVIVGGYNDDFQMWMLNLARGLDKELQA